MSNIRKLLTAWTRPIQKLEDTAQTLMLMRDVRYATGIWLDELGALVGQPRNGVADDEVYRRFVMARTIVNKSDGQPETMYRIVRTALGDTEHTLAIENLGIAAFTIRVDGLPLTWTIANLIILLLRKAVSGGVRVVLEFALLDEDDTFTFEDGDGLGFGDSSDPDVGGGLASSLE